LISVLFLLKENASILLVFLEYSVEKLGTISDKFDNILSIDFVDNRLSKDPRSSVIGSSLIYFNLYSINRLIGEEIYIVEVLSNVRSFA
jgi:hypothetical protein